ncbi:MAG TPA: hypothetical protein VER98_16365, partial [Terriglobia bacterium]|nr:hypothetical protein [Terriglobia bacterium]
MMTRRTRIVLALVAVMAVLAWVLIPNNKARIKAERTRRLLHQRGFRTELSDFDLTLKPDVRDRAQRILRAGIVVRDLIPNRGFDLFRPAGSNAAVVLSKEENFVTEYSTNLWPTFRNDLSVRRAVLDNACTAILAGPIRFEPAKGFAGDFDLTYLAEIRSLAAALAARTLLELHDQHTDAA